MLRNALQKSAILAEQARAHIWPISIEKTKKICSCIHGQSPIFSMFSTDLLEYLKTNPKTAQLFAPVFSLEPRSDTIPFPVP